MLVDLTPDLGVKSYRSHPQSVYIYIPSEFEGLLYRSAMKSVVVICDSNDSTTSCSSICNHSLYSAQQEAITLLQITIISSEADVGVS